MVSLITIVSLMIWENLDMQNVYKVVKTQEKPRFVTTIRSHINVPPQNRILIFSCNGYALIGGVR